MIEYIKALEEDFANKMSKPVSKEDEKKIKVSERFDRCSSGEY